MKNVPLNRVDPLGLYDVVVHYYMTYFLATVAGLPPESAKRIAYATQYVDDDPSTNPVPNKQELLKILAADVSLGNVLGLSIQQIIELLKETKETYVALKQYHFVLDDRNGWDGDRSGRSVSESDHDYAMRRFVSPDSVQLALLRSEAINSQNVGCRKQNHDKLDNYGKYLHAFQDTFSHRDQMNRPLSVFNVRGLVGHALFGHRPDKTYNGGYIKQSHKGVAPEYLPVEDWNYNELRTLQMEKEVFEAIQRDFSNEILENNGRSLSWKDIAGDGDSRIGRPAINDKYNHSRISKHPEGITGILQKFNSFNESAYSDGFERKISILNEFLVSQGYKKIPEYKAKSRDL